MRYSYVARSESKHLTFVSSVVVKVEGNTATIFYHKDFNQSNDEQSILFKDASSDVCLVTPPEYSVFQKKYSMLIPESHPYYNYGLIVYRLRYDIPLDVDDGMRRAIVELFKEVHTRYLATK